MIIDIEGLKAPTEKTLDKWLNTPRKAKCGQLFTPTKAMWKPNSSADSVNWQPAILCVAPDWRRWLHAALAYYMVKVAQGTVYSVASVLSRAVQSGLKPLSQEHCIDLRERFNRSEFSVLVCFMEFWHECESVGKRPSLTLGHL